MGINNKLTYLNDTKTAIKKAIIDKGVDVLDTDTFRSYAEKIGQIEGGGSGGSGGEVIEAIVDESVLPIEADKKVVVADIQATGQGAGALMPFDIVPYNATSGSVYTLLQLRGEYSLHVNVNDSSGPAHIGYKKVGDRWEGKFFTNTISGVNKPNDSFNLLYDSSYNGYFGGSSGKYWNPIKERVEAITFDKPLTPSSVSNVTTRYFLTYDSKYLWAVHLNVGSTNQSNAKKGLICLYAITIDDATGEVFAHKKTEEFEFETYEGIYQLSICSLNHYGIIVTSNHNGYKISYAQYNEAENTLTVQVGVGFWNDTRYVVTAFTKDWLLFHYTYDRANRVYWGDAFTATMQGKTSNGIVANGHELASFGNMFYPLANSYNVVGNDYLMFLKMPVDKEQPVPDDFKFYIVTCHNSEAGPYMIDEENFYMGASWENDCVRSFRYYNIPNNTRTEFDPRRVPVMLLDDGTGCFYSNTANLLNYNKADFIAPVEGSYNNGTVLKTIDPSGYSTSFYKMINTESTASGQGFRFGTLPMNYICQGDSFIFHNFCSGTASSSAERGWFFKNPAEDPIKLEWTTPRALVVGQNKAYITPAYLSDTQHPLTVIDADGVKNYTVVTDWSSQFTSSGVFFEFENKLYSYQYRKNNTTIGGHNCYEIVLDGETMTATYAQLDAFLYSPMSWYITQDSMHPSNPYPLTSQHSLYSKPVLTKDGKYFVGLAGNHTTHYAKIEKHETGYPILNVYEFPQKLKNLLHTQEILYFEAYYPSGFGIQLANGTFLLCEYTQGLDVDLNITTYRPAHSYAPNSSNQCLMHFTSHKHYWYFSAGTYWNNGSVAGYAGCGRRDDLPSTYQKKVCPLMYNLEGADYVTGHLTGESRIDENGQMIAEVRMTGMDLSRKQDRFLVEELLSETTLKNNTIFRADEKESVELLLPETLDYDFLCEVDFTSGETPTEFTMLDSIKWTGDDIEDDSFVPLSNKRYNLLFWYDGLYLKGIVKGVEL